MKTAKPIAPFQAKFQLTEFATVLSMTVDQARLYLEEHFKSTGALHFVFEEDSEWVHFNSENLSYALPLNHHEWFKLSHFLHAQGKLDDELEQIKYRLTDGGKTKMMMDFLNQIEAWDHERDFEMLSDLKKYVESKTFIRLTHQSHKTYELLGLNVIHVEGVLSLVAEELTEHCLMVFPLREIKQVSAFEDDELKPQASKLELEDFVKAMRLMSEKETRLILKIYDPNDINLFPEHHFLGKPCMITNPEGDLIWAAYVEPCQDLFEWIITLGESVEILDPLKFKEDYYRYCLEKYKRSA